jgi:hypothetical protein
VGSQRHIGVCTLELVTFPLLNQILPPFCSSRFQRSLLQAVFRGVSFGRVFETDTNRTVVSGAAVWTCREGRSSVEAGRVGLFVTAAPTGTEPLSGFVLR